MKDINIILGERIKLRRKAVKLTQEKLAEMADVTPRFLAEVEAGKTGVSLQTLKNISLALSVSTDYLLGLDSGNELTRLDVLFNNIADLNEKFYPLLSAVINELKNIR